MDDKKWIRVLIIVGMILLSCVVLTNARHVGSLTRQLDAATHERAYMRAQMETIHIFIRSLEYRRFGCGERTTSGE